MQLAYFLLSVPVGNFYTADATPLATHRSVGLIALRGTAVETVM